MQVAWTKDVFRAIDYLQTRPDLDTSRLAYYATSMGSFYGPIPVALEPRIKVAIFALGGLRFNAPQEIQPVNSCLAGPCRCCSSMAAMTS